MIAVFDIRKAAQALDNTEILRACIQTGYPIVYHCYQKNLLPDGTHQGVSY